MTPSAEPLVCSLLALAESHAERPAFLTDAGPVSYAQFARSVRGAAARLRREGQRRGDRVALCAPNGPDLAAAYFAVHAAGGVATPLDPDMPIDAARWIVEDSDARLALTSRDLGLSVPTQNLHDFCRPADGELLDTPDCTPDDPADLLYTTGTTGRQKGVLLTHHNIAQAAANINAFIGTESTDVELVPIALSHSFGLGRLRVMAQAGHTLALEPGMRNPARTLKRLLDLKATGMAIVPAGFDLILRMTGKRLGDARGHLRYVEIGSAPMRMDIKQQLMDLLPDTRICHHYGLTEASRAAFIDYHRDRNKLASIGRASPNVRIAVQDSDGHEMPAGHCGEIVVRGGMVMQGYWRQPELTRQALRDGWLHTGDWGYRDADGYLYLAGRQSDLVNVAGWKVSPEEVERALAEHPAILDTACVGVPDPQGITGECIKAYIVTRTAVDETKLVQWLRTHLEEFKIPRVWQRVDRIPRTSSGKTQRHLMEDS